MKGQRLQLWIIRWAPNVQLPPSGFEPGTFSFKVQHSTTELKRHVPLAELVGTWLSFVTQILCSDQSIA
jgi:hypothetical protein